MSRSLEVVELTGMGCPSERANCSRAQDERDRQDQKNDAHEGSFLLNVRARSASVTTEMELSGMSTAAKSGSRRPVTAKAIPIKL